MTRAIPASRATQGFSLVEVVLAAALGSVALLAAIQATSDVLDSATVLEQAAVGDLDRALEQITRDVRDAWWVRCPSREVLEVADERGAVTRYELEGDRLRIRRPGGHRGTLASGLSRVDFGALTMTRLREGLPRVESGVIHAVTGLDFDRSVSLGDGSTLRLGFVLAADQGGVDDAGVEERLLHAVPERLLLQAGQGVWNAGRGSPGTLQVRLELAAAPGDARPRLGGRVLGMQGLPATQLPDVWMDGTDISTYQDGKGLTRVWVCHDGGEASVALESLMDHVAHGDLVGGCGPAAVDVFATPAAEVVVELDLAGERLVPGVAYSLVLAPQGAGAVTVFAARRGPATAQVLRAAAGDQAAEPLDRVVPFVLRGQRTLTTTDAIDVVTSLTITLVPADGSVERTASAPVLSQRLATDPWRGVVPGETAARP